MQIFITGGEKSGSDGFRKTKDSWSVTNSVLIYSLAEDSWTEVAPMNQARCAHGSCACGATVWVFAGLDAQSNYLGDVEYLGTDSQQQW